LTKTIRITGYFLVYLAFLFSCSPTYKNYLSEYQFTKTTQIPDYSNLQYWAANPSKHGPADSVPSPLIQSSYRDSTVDVFFLYPTSFVDANDTAWNADINDATLNAKTDYSSILCHASAFN
jgi:hypothetical protein